MDDLTGEELDKTAKLRQSVRTIMGNGARRDRDLYIVYSSHPVRELLGQDHKPIYLKEQASGPERRIVLLKDAQGIARVQAMLHTAGKDERVHPITTDTFRGDYWQHNLLLVGANPSNPRTHQALAEFECPLKFSDAANFIYRRDSPEDRWPADAADPHDYGMIVRIKPEDDVTYIILAGVTSTATRACCEYFVRHIDDLAEEFDDRQFAYVIAVDRAAEISKRERSFVF